MNHGTGVDVEDAFAQRVHDVLAEAGFSVRPRRGTRVTVDVPAEQEA